MTNPISSVRLGLAVLAAAGFAAPAYSQTIADALDNPVGVTFSTLTFDNATGLPYPGIEWFGQTGVSPGASHDGIDAAKATGLPGGTFSRIDATIQGPGTLSFWWKSITSNPATPFETLGFAAENTNYTAPRTDIWNFRSASISCGEQKVAWYVDVNEFVPTPSISAWLDEVVFTPIPNVPAVQTGLDNSTTTFHSNDWLQGPYSQTPAARNGTVAKSGPVNEGGSSRMEFGVVGPFEISFDWGMEADTLADATTFQFKADGTVPNDGILSASQKLEGRSYEFGPGQHCMVFTYFRGYPYVFDPENPDPPYTGPAEGFVDNMVITQIPSSAVLADAVDLPPDVYGKAWYRQTLVSHDGTDAACVSGLLAGEVEKMYVELPDDPGLLSFWIKLSTEVNYGYMDFSVDGQFIGNQRISGEQDWTKIEVNLEQGQNRVLTIYYGRDTGGSGSVGSNIAYVDQIKLEPGATNFQPDLSIRAPGGGGWAGKNRYNSSGVSQVAKYQAKRRRPFGKFKMRCQNDCPTDADTLKLYGTKSNKNFEIYYIVKSDGKFYNISAEFQTGQFSTDTLEILQSAPYEVWIAAKDGYRKRSQTARVRGVSNADGSKIDTVKARMKIDRR